MLIRQKYLNALALTCKFYTFFYRQIMKLLTYHMPFSH